MFSPNSTPIWLLFIFAAVPYFVWPPFKRFVSKYTEDEGKQNFFALILTAVVSLLIVTLSVIFVP